MLYVKECQKLTEHGGGSVRVGASSCAAFFGLCVNAEMGVAWPLLAEAELVTHRRSAWLRNYIQIQTRQLQKYDDSAKQAPTRTQLITQICSACSFIRESLLPLLTVFR